MAHKILIFKLFILIFLLSVNILNAKTIIGVPKIIDGDSININSNKIRLYGIDAPEIKQNCIFQKKKWNCGKQSSDELKKLISNRIVKCIVKNIDKYNRYVAICLINEVNINSNMVKKGWAIAYRYYSLDYIIEEMHARDNKLGIWRGEFEIPYIFRKKIK